MGNLKGRGLPNRIGKPRSRFSPAIDRDRDRDKHRRKTKPWRAWYHTPAWEAIKRQVYKRDEMTCQRTGVLLVGAKNAANSPVVHHRIPHRGNRERFFDVENCELVSKKWHDTEGQKEDWENDYLG